MVRDGVVEGELIERLLAWCEWDDSHKGFYAPDAPVHFKAWVHTRYTGHRVVIRGDVKAA